MLLDIFDSSELQRSLKNERKWIHLITSDTFIDFF